MSNVQIAAIRFVVASAITLAATAPAEACIGCESPQVSLSEQLLQSDAVVLVEWIEGKRPKGQTAGSTIYRIESVLKSPENLLNKDDRIVLARFRSAQVGDLFILIGNRATVIEWGSPFEISRAGYAYLANAPSPKDRQVNRLPYYLKFLEHPDHLVANDAFSEFANAAYHDIAPLADKMPRERIRKWIGSSDTSVTRLGLSGLMLGLCGKADDAKLLRHVINESSDEFRLGIDSLMIGYILLLGEEGLDEIDRTKLKTKILLDEEGKPVLDKEGNTTPLPFSETCAAMQALRFMKRFAPKVIEQERLKQSMRILFDRPKWADLVIADLARWKDWAVQDRLMALYGADEYNVPSIKRAIIRYMLVSTKDIPDDATSSSEPPHVAAGIKHLAALEKIDPKTVREAKRFFFLQ
jgi:hypothetical protein